jgi:hypothetical protein
MTRVLLVGDMRWERFIADKGQLEVVNDLVHHGLVREESNDAYRAAALRINHRVNFTDFADRLGPALEGDGPELVLHHPESEGSLS